MKHGNRRELLAAGLGLAAGPALAAGKKSAKDQEVSPGEDLMREHGVLNRVLLLYDEAGRREYERLGEQFEQKEHELLGAQGFEKAVAEVAELEKALGVYDLAQFTPS